MRYLVVLLMVALCNVSCVNQGNTHAGQVKTQSVTVESQVGEMKKKLIVNHTKDYKTMARSIPKMPPSKEFHYDNHYAIPDVDAEISEDAASLIVPPESKH